MDEMRGREKGSNAAAAAAAAAAAGMQLASRASIPT